MEKIIAAGIVILYFLALGFLVAGAVRTDKAPDFDSADDGPEVEIIRRLRDKK
jgi:hypothetical protein